MSLLTAGIAQILLVWQSIAPWYDRLEEKGEWIFLSTGLFGYRPLRTLARLMPLLLRYVVGKKGIYNVCWGWVWVWFLCVGSRVVWVCCDGGGSVSRFES